MKLLNSRVIRTAGVLLLGILLLCGCEKDNNAATSEANEPTKTVEDGSQASLPQSLSNEKYYIVKVSVNPEISLYVSTESNKVIHVDYENEDAEELLTKASISLEGKDYNESVEDFVKACADQDYLNNENNTVEIIAAKASADAERVPDTYNERLDEVLEEIDNYVDFEVDLNIPCPYCDATGLCDLCHGDEKMVCNVCQGETEIICDICSETGKVVCGLCNGDKIVGEKGICRECNGIATWQCTDCNGSGKLVCTKCGGAGKLYCESCGDTGTQTCNLCNGAGCAMCNKTGIMECTTCHGHTAYSCGDCEGTGEVYCNSCRGTGSCVCYSCEGTGLFDNTTTCMQCEGTGLELCPKCHGTCLSTCYGCSGTGFMVCVRCDGDRICNQCHGAKELANQGQDN